MSLQIGTIYEVKADDCEFPQGTRVEFCGGIDDDVFSDGASFDWLSSEEVTRSTDQSPLEFDGAAQAVKSKAQAGMEIF